jgi:hypothetical protein
MSAVERWIGVHDSKVGKSVLLAFTKSAFTAFVKGVKSEKV